MRYRQLGSSDLKVSEISLGSWLTYGVGVDTSVARACVDAAFEAGVNFFDTANVYGQGAAELFLGEALATRQRDSYVLATKLYFPMDDANRGLSRVQIEKQLDASLRRLRTDVIDLYQCHRYDEDTPLAETMEALTRAVEGGKVRAIGFSEWSPQQIEAALAMTGVEKFVSSQPQYSLLWRRPEKAIIPLCNDNGISQIVWSPLAQGVLSGKYRPSAPPPADSRASNPAMSDPIRGWLKPAILDAVDEVKPIAVKAGMSLAQFALAWVLREPDVASAIIGASRPEQVAENAEASGAYVDPELFARAEAIVASARGTG